MNSITPQKDYSEFLRTKALSVKPCGFAVNDADLHPALFDFQRDIVKWALARGRAAVFADCGLGKSPIQIEIAHHINIHTGGNVLILAPLAVSQQTVREGVKFDRVVHPCRSQADVKPGINITNYEMLQHFDPQQFCGLVLDESSILKGFNGSTRKSINEFSRGIPYRLACTATPAPNDLLELTNHAEFLDVMNGKEIIALFFTQDGNTTHKFRLKGHARQDFWKWMASWSVAMRKPSDLGYDDTRFILPKLHVHHHVVDGGTLPGRLFPVEALTLQERQGARRESVDDRTSVIAEMVNKSNDPWIVWCNLNTESDALTRAIPDAIEVRGSDTPEHKETAMIDFSAGRSRVLVTKPSIAGHGLNWQHCRNVAFVGLSDSFEQYYQAVRRCWRFGQTQEVHCHIVTAETEGAVVSNIQRKERESGEMMENIVKEMSGLSLGKQEKNEMEYREDEVIAPNWRMLLGDSVLRTKELDTDSVGLTLFSPPFPGMYAYTNSSQDVGNSDSIAEMMEHYAFLVPELLRVTQPGRMCCVHLMQLTAMKSRDGYIGLKDYRGAVIQTMMDGGWVYAGEVTIDKNPQVQAVRNKERGLLFKSLATDSAMMRMALADYLIYFRKPGENPKPIQAGISQKYNAGHGWITEQEWIEWASPVWYRHTQGKPGGIRETDVLNVSQARDSNDERHLCPLQLGVIERAVKLWSAPGDVVFSPFAGIGSEGYGSLILDRQFVGIELKQSYFDSAVKNLMAADGSKHQLGLFAEVDGAA